MPDSYTGTDAFPVYITRPVGTDSAVAASIRTGLGQLADRTLWLQLAHLAADWVSIKADAILPHTGAGSVRIDDLAKGADGNLVKCVLEAGFGFLLQNSANTQTITSVEPVRTTITGASINLGGLLAGDIVEIEVGPLYAYPSVHNGLFAIRVDEPAGIAEVAQVPIIDDGWRAHFSGHYTVLQDGAVNVSLEGATLDTGGSILVTQATGAPLIRAKVFR